MANPKEFFFIKIVLCLNRKLIMLKYFSKMGKLSFVLFFFIISFFKITADDEHSNLTKILEMS